MLRRVKAPKVPRRLGGEEVLTSSERVGGAEGAEGGTVGAGASGWTDISEMENGTLRLGRKDFCPLVQI
jgi:hypothetical protein